MGLLEKLKSALGLDGADSGPGGDGSGARDADVTVEHEPGAATEEAVKGVDTGATAGTTPGADPDPDTGAAAPTPGADPDADSEPVIREAETDADGGGAARSGGAETDSGADTLGADPEAGVAAEAEVDADAGTDTAGAEANGESEAAGTDVTDHPGAGVPVEELTGIGPAYAGRLTEAGVDSVADLAGADADDLEEATGIGAGRIEGWIEQAEEY